MTSANERALNLGRDGAERFAAGLSSDELPGLLRFADEVLSGQSGLRVFDRAEVGAALGPRGSIGRRAAAILGEAARPVRAILFDKTAGNNWAVPWHQDRTIAVRARHDVPGFGPWSVKTGVVHVEPPFDIIAGMITIRAHLDDCTADNAPLLIAPGSHRLGRVAATRAAGIARARRPVSPMRAISGSMRPRSCMRRNGRRSRGGGACCTSTMQARPCLGVWNGSGSRHPARMEAVGGGRRICDRDPGTRRALAMYIVDQAIKEDPARRWALPDRVFFACGACHILAYAFLERYPAAGFKPIWIKPHSGYIGNHIIASDGEVAFDYHGYSTLPALVAHAKAKAGRRWPGWGAELIALPADVLVSERKSRSYDRLWLREPRQFLHDALPRAHAFLARFRAPTGAT